MAVSMTARCLCAGAAHWDVIARADSPLTADADVPGRIVRRPGGVATNAALALAREGLDAGLIAAIGHDAEGDALVGVLAARRVDCRGLLRSGGQTDCYVAIQAADGTLYGAVADCRTLDQAADSIAARVRERLADGSEPFRVVVDGNLPPPVLHQILADAEERGLRAAFLPPSPEKARAAEGLCSAIATFYGNVAEAGAVSGETFDGAEAAARHLAQTGWAAAMVTDGAHAAAYADADNVQWAEPQKMTAGGVTGAGDALAAAHIAALAKGCTTAEALRLALRAAARHIAGECP